MQRRVYLTKLKAEFREEYIEAHRNVSADLLSRYGQAGMRYCSVHLLDDTLVLITESEDHEQMAQILAQDPVDREWQQYVGPMKEDGDWRQMEQLFTVDL